MKNTLQAAALIVMAASAVVAAATSRHQVHEKCSYEWEAAFERINTKQPDNLVVVYDSNVLNQSQTK